MEFQEYLQLNVIIAKKLQSQYFHFIPSDCTIWLYIMYFKNTPSVKKTKSNHVKWSKLSWSMNFEVERSQNLKQRLFFFNQIQDWGFALNEQIWVQDIWKPIGNSK